MAVDVTFKQMAAFWDALTSMHEELRHRESEKHTHPLIDRCPACIPALEALVDLGWVIPGFPYSDVKTVKVDTVMMTTSGFVLRS